MSWRRFFSAFLALLLFVSGSGAAMVCVEADGTARIELLATLCCDPQPVQVSSPIQGEGISPIPPCAGCDDRPLDEARWSRQTGQQEALAIVLSPAPVAVLLSAPDRAVSIIHLASTESGPPTPRSSRPANLRC